MTLPVFAVNGTKGQWCSQVRTHQCLPRKPHVGQGLRVGTRGCLETQCCNGGRTAGVRASGRLVALSFLSRNRCSLGQQLARQVHGGNISSPNRAPGPDGTAPMLGDVTHSAGGRQSRDGDTGRRTQLSAQLPAPQGFPGSRPASPGARQKCSPDLTPPAGPDDSGV